MTLFLDMKFLESQLLWSLILQDDLFFLFLVFLTMFISIDPSTWDLFLAGKMQRCLKLILNSINCALKQAKTEFQLLTLQLESAFSLRKFFKNLST